MPDRTIAVRVDEKLFDEVKKRLIDTKQSMKDYVVSLIMDDLESADEIVVKTEPITIQVTRKELEAFLNSHELKWVEK